MLADAAASRNAAFAGGAARERVMVLARPRRRDRRMNRRAFLGGVAMAAVARPGIAAPARGVAPAGWLGRRMALAERRLLEPGFPTFSQRFVLADVTLDPTYPRLYDRFSGDISGRYLEALSTMDTPSARARLAPLVPALLAQQRADGRFGDEALRFTATDVGRDQMALLWGNGRLLVGLLAYH